MGGESCLFPPCSGYQVNCCEILSASLLLEDFEVNLADPYSEANTDGECSPVAPTPDPTTFGCGVDESGNPKTCTGVCTTPPCDPAWPGACTSNADCTDVIPHLE